MEDKLSINIFLKESDNPFASYYSHDDLHLSTELEDFILSKLHSAKRKNIELLFDGQTEIDENLLKTATVNSFTNLMKTDERIYARNIKKSIILFVFGIIIGLFYLKLQKSHAYIGGILSIICWVFIWSGTEVYFFENLQIKQKIKKCKNILHANIYKK